MRQCSIFVTHLKNEYIEVELNKGRCFCSFRCLSNPYSCTISSLIFRTRDIRALLSVRKFLRVQVSVRIFPDPLINYACITLVKLVIDSIGFQRIFASFSVSKQFIGVSYTTRRALSNGTIRFSIA